MLANIEVATPSGMPASPIMAKVPVTAIPAGTMHTIPQRNERNRIALTVRIPSSEASSEPTCERTIASINAWLTATSPANSSRIRRGARCSRSYSRTAAMSWRVSR